MKASFSSCKAMDKYLVANSPGIRIYFFFSPWRNTEQMHAARAVREHGDCQVNVNELAFISWVRDDFSKGNHNPPLLFKRQGNACFSLQLVLPSFSFLWVNLFALSSSSPWAWEVHGRNDSSHCLVTCAVLTERPALAWLGCWCRGASISHSNNYVIPYAFWQCRVCGVGDVFVPRALEAARVGGHPCVPHWYLFAGGHGAWKPAGCSLFML